MNALMQITDEDIRWNNPPLQATLTPAYGLDYKSEGAVLHDFRSGKTFTAILHGRRGQCNIFDYRAGDLVKIRYNDGAFATFYRVSKSDLSF